MKKDRIIIDILSQLNLKYKTNEPLSKHTSVRVGGNTNFFAEVKTKKQFIELLERLNKFEIKYQILGNGTNVLASDNGFDGVVICTKKMKRYKVSKNSVYVQAGMGLFEFGKLLKKYGLAGLEFLFGIPGSVGGAIVMNAGAFEKNIGDYVDYVLAFVDGKIKKIKQKDMCFSYRNSLAQQKEMVIVGAKFNLKFGSSEDIENLQNKYFQTKLAYQPYDKLSFGSAFKRVDGKAVSKMIDELGLKGFRIGGAEISKKHAGFIINIGDATCQDYLKMIKYIQQKIFDEYGVVVEPEVKFLW